MQRTVQHATTPRTRRLIRFAQLGAAAQANDEQQTVQHATNPRNRKLIRFAPLVAAAPGDANQPRKDVVATKRKDVEDAKKAPACTQKTSLVVPGNP